MHFSSLLVKFVITLVWYLHAVLPKFGACQNKPFFSGNLLMNIFRAWAYRIADFLVLLSNSTRADLMFAGALIILGDLSLVLVVSKAVLWTLQMHNGVLFLHAMSPRGRRLKFNQNCRYVFIMESLFLKNVTNGERTILTGLSLFWN